ncbi:hypothetical protein QU487_02330 [Crenobacter sp. SG2305]|uniref:hypothetical protein n=1 Tax=Crenobacter oryzisoli TaxID=3056844 RepID=UPI0025AB3886|nr:hypothetical protein [Crenobacter sp. SG2305]MDN0081597.1 hypothetical protein [Crenobacter sp. SG2305]
MKLKSLLAILAIALTGCASTADGFKFGRGGSPSSSDIEKAKQQLASNVKSSSVKKAIGVATAPTVELGIIVIGTVGPFRPVDGEKRHQFYVSYDKEAQKFHPAKGNVLSEEDFVKTIAGWTSIEVFSIPGVMNQRLPALVKETDRDQVTFASTFGSFMLGSTGDLVAARSNADGELILNRILCHDKDPNYRACAVQYERGRFDANTGQEVADGFKPKSNGALIDVTTYMLAKK